MTGISAADEERVEPPSASADRLLVVKLADLGDLLLSEPALRSLRAAFPAARIDLLTSPPAAALAPLLGHDLGLVTFPQQLFDDPRAIARPDRLLLAARLARRLRRADYDRVVLLHHLTTPAGARKFRALARAAGAPVVVGLDNGRGDFLTACAADLGFGAMHEADYMLRVAQAAGGAPVDPRPRVVEPPASVALPADYAVIYPATGAYSTARTWPAERFASVAADLTTRDLRIVIVGAADASEAARTISAAVPDALDLTGQTTLPQLAAVVASARVVVGGDSFIGHLAAALDRPLVAVFGPSNDDAWKPHGATRWAPGVASRRLVVRQDIPCAPCLYTGFSLGRRDGCPTRTCLATLPVESAAHAARVAGGVE